MISLTSSQLHMARVIQLTLLLDCARKLGLRDSVSFDLNYEEKQNQETSSRSPSVQSAHLGGGAASRSDVIAGTSVVVHEAENVFQSNHSLPIERDHSDENFFCARIHNSNSVCSPTVSSRESLVTFQTEMRHLDSGMSVCADASMEIDSNNTNEKNVNDGELYTDCTVTSNHAVSDSPLIQTQTEKLSSGVKQLGTSCFYDNSCVSSVPSTDCQFPKSINSKSNEISFVNPSQITVSTCKSKSSTSLLSESQFENALEGLHPSLHDHSFGSLNKFHQKTSALSSSPVVSSTLSASKSLCTSGDIFSHATVIHSTSPTVMKYSLSSASNPNNGRVQSSCDSAFDALLLGEPEKQSSAETPSSIVASSTAGDNIAVEGSFSNILLQPTNSQMLEKANAAARRRRQSLTTDIPRPTRFLLDDAEEVAGTGQPYFGAAFHDEDAPYLKDSPAQNRGLFLPVLKSSLPSNSRLEALTNNLGKLDCSITNISSIDSCHLFNSKTVSSNDRSSNACSYAETSELREESEINFCSPLITSCVTSSLGDRVQSSNFPPSVERKSGCKQSSDNLNLPNKKVKLENTKRDVPRAAIPNAIEDNSNQISSQAIQQDTRVLLTSSSNLTDGKQALFDSGKIVNVGFQFPRGEIKNSLNCYEIKPRDDLSFEVVPSSVAWKGKAHVLPQNHMNETELNNHAKIITEVLKKFPNLIKDKKNVKLKIMKQELDKNLSNSTTQAESSSSNSVISAKSTESARSITFRCFKCLQLFATHFSLKKHVLNSHEDPAEVLRQSGSKLHACWRCSGQSRCFDSYVQLQRHLREAHRSEQLQCGECSYRSSKNVDLAFHKFKEHGTLPNNFHFPKCKMCNFVGRSASDLERHCASKHSTDSYACSSCDVSFRSLGALQGHVQAKVCQNKPGASFTCPHCSETFSKSYNLKAHLRSRHKNLKFKRAEATSSGRVNENISFVHTSESHPDQDARETTVEHKQASGCTVPSYLPFENKISFDASDDIQVDNSCTSSSFIVSTLKPNEAYGINSDSDFIEIVGSCTDVGASYATRPLTLGTILDVMPSTSSGYVPSCTVSADAVWTCLSSDASVASVPSSAMKDPMTE